MMEEQLELKEFASAAVGVKSVTAPPPRGAAIPGSGPVSGPRIFTYSGQEQGQTPDRPALVRGMVKAVMVENEDTRNNYRLLYTEVLKKYFPDALKCPHCGKPLEKIELGPSPETIRRRCQEIQHSGSLIPIDPAVLSVRGFLNECILKKLREEGALDGKPVGYAHAVCRKCKKRETGDCLEQPDRMMIG